MPHLVSVQNRSTTILVTFRQDNTCFEDYQFQYNLSWVSTSLESEKGYVVVNVLSFKLDQLIPSLLYIVTITSISGSQQTPVYSTPLTLNVLTLG